MKTAADHLILAESETCQDLLRQIQDGEDLVRQLLGQAEDVRIVLREAPDAEETLQCAGALVPVDGAELNEAGNAQGA